MRIAVDGSGTVELEDNWNACIDWFLERGEEMRQMLSGWNGTI